MDLEWKW